MFFYRLLRYASSLPVCICILGMGYYIFIALKSLCKREHLPFSTWLDRIKAEANIAGSFTIPLLIIALCGVLITNTAVHQLVGIHNLNLKPEGTYCFYVEAHRYGGKTYTLPAQISVEKETVEVSEEKSKTYTYYYIEKVFFSNGGWLDTSDNESVKIGESAHHWTADGEEWELTLLNEHAFSPSVTETNNATEIDIAFLLIEVISVSFFLYAIARKD